MSIIRIRNHNDRDAKVKWSTSTVEVCEHRLKAEYRTTLFVFSDQLHALSVPWGVEAMISGDGRDWTVMQASAPRGQLEKNAG
jgi:hypothetical protein